MPREHRIAWNENQRKKLNSAVRRYNNAIRKASKSNPLASEFLPSEVSYKELKAQITTRRALNNVVNRLTRATRPEALTFVRQEDGSVVTRYERREYSILKSVRERKKRMTAKRKGIEQPGKGRIGTLEQAQLSPDTRKASSFSAKSLRRFLEYQERELNMSSVEKAQRYFSNYTRAIQSVFGGFSDYDDAISAIEDKILGLAAKDFDALKEAIDESPSIEFIYEPQARDAKLARLEEYWMAIDVRG